MKWHRGRMFSVSCRQLGTGPTKEASWKAANEWWQAKEAGLRKATPSNPPLDGPSELVRSLLERIGQGRHDAGRPGGEPSWARASVSALLRLVEQGDSARMVLEMLERASIEGAEWGEGTGPMPFPEAAVIELCQGNGLSPGVIDGVLTQPLPHQLTPEQREYAVGQLAVQISPGQVSPDRTTASQVEGWVKLQSSKHNAGKISAGRFDAYRRNIAVFRDWFGGGKDVGEITAQTLRDYYHWLGEQIRGGRFSPSYSRSLFNASKNFITRLAEMEVVPLPKNMRSRDFVFDDTPGSITYLTVAEVRALLAGCDEHSERTKLFLLLMLNCGMYQGDISDLKHGEVDWDGRTITRRRSKRKKQGRVVTYRLWPETYDLLVRFRTEGGDRVLLSEEGNPLVLYRVDQAGDLDRHDLINQAYRHLCKRVGVKKSLKVFHKTAANMLERHRTYGRYYPYFLAHSPRGVSERNYGTPSDELFFEALEWLREQLIVAPDSGPAGPPA
jgi:integrase